MFYNSPHVASRRRASSRAPFIASCLLLLVAAAGVFWHRPAAGQGAESGGLKTVSDMLVVKGDGGDTVYVADGDTGAIFYLEAAAAQEARQYRDFKLLVRTAPGFKKPSGLAYRQGKLVGCDSEANACFEIDLAPGGDRTPKELNSPGMVRQPEHVAATEAGALAFASDQQVQYIAPGMSAPRTIVKETRDIDRIGFDGQTLVVFDENDAGDLYGFDLDAVPESGVASLRGHPKLLPARTRSQMPALKDFALYRGVYYFAGVKSLFVVARPQP